MKKYIKVCALVLVAITLVTVFSACGKNPEFAGTWYQLNESGERTGNKLVLTSNGKGKVTDNNISGTVTWEVKGDVFLMTVSVLGFSESYKCSYEFSGKTLTLTDAGKDAVLVYEKD